MRKIIQLVVSHKTKSDQTQNVLYALCDDGSVWWRNSDTGSRWYLESESISQGEISPDIRDEDFSRDIEKHYV